MNWEQQLSGARLDATPSSRHRTKRASKGANVIILLWAIFRPFYLFGLPFVVILLWFTIANGISQDIEFALPVILFTLMYFAVGYACFISFPNRLRSKLTARIQANKSRTFNPLVEATGYLSNRAVVLDPKNRKMLYVDMLAKTEEILDYDDIQGWQMLSRGDSTSLTFATDSPTNPTIGIKISTSQLNIFGAWLQGLK
ncbi:hypothetical protein [Azohydromonas lata]|uniref:hypothetical protein n=1 Tax=Azohydromonas lata TaxID=45677 RepID=UPI0012F4D4BB|nr:hypothetical protein [Azohydromonas lata]